jgi:hypothetical protein
MSGYLMSEKTKNGVINLLAQKSLDITSGRRRSRGGGWSQPRSTVYDGAFAVSLKDDTTVTVKEGSVIAGIETTAVPETDKSISSTCILYLELTYDGGYTAELKTAAEMPELSEDNYTQQIAAITVTDSKISAITQIWESGDIVVLGRLT